ncbi:MAG: hypothetical protein HRU40_03345 [Saprospiraceae bacterium]|nr:hypothetical protein [Saprospiraceae bacterium]
MRNLYLLFFFCTFFFATTLEGQSISEENRSMSMGMNNGFTLETEGLEGKELEGVIKDFLKQFKGRKAVKFDRRNKEFFIDDASIKDISTNTVDIYAGYRQTGNLQHEVTFWFDLGGAYLSSDDHVEATKYVREEMLPDLNDAVYDEMIAIELSSEESRLKTMNKDYDKLAKEQKKLEDLIEECKMKIEQAEQDLVTNISAQEEMVKTIEEQQTVVDAVKKKLRKN